MRRLLFSLVSTKIPHSPSHWITAAAVLKDIPQCLCRLSYIGVYRRSDSPRYSERRARYFFALPSVSTKAAFFHAAQSSDRSPQRHPPPTRPEPAGRSELLWQTPVASEREELSTACYPVYRIIQTVSNQSPSLSSFSLPQ